VNPPCRILLIEDDHAEAAAIEGACCPNPSTGAFDVVNDGEQAEEALLEREYDLIICDLALPSDGRLFEPDAAEGLRLFALIRERMQGTPVIVLSGHADPHMMPRFFEAGGHADLYGLLTEEPLVRFFAKEDLLDCVDAVKTHIARTAVLDGVVLEIPSGVDLPLSDQRALRIYARRTGARRGSLEPLDGGLSGSRTFRLTLGDTAAGDSSGVVVAKLGDLRKVIREASRYDQLAARLPVGLGAHVLFVVRAGAGSRGALIYQLADEHTSSLFELATVDEPQAVKAIERLRERMVDWVASAPDIVRSLSEIRRASISDVDLMAAAIDAPDERAIDVTIRESMAHADLHGFNVLVTPHGDPTLIDYGEVRRAPASLDPVTLELSLVFHPNMAGRLGTWPSADQALRWVDLDTYCEACPFEALVRACREWALNVAATPEEVAASAYAYALRQVKYRQPTLALAVAVAEGAQAVLRP
jgi:CheY-like chemotaxis protein